MRSRIFAFVSIFQLWSLSAFPQGALTPPGPPAPNMKTLDQIEPRKPINALPLTISQPGSYYLGKNLQFTAASGNGITITVSNVTLDLMGFTLNSSNAVTGDAIHINPTVHGISISNGSIAGNTTVTVSGNAPNQTWTVKPAGFNYGINALSSASCHFSHLHISGCRAAGLEGGEQAFIEQVTATQNGNAGIEASSGNVIGCTTVSNGTFGIACSNGNVANSTASSNQTTGVSAASVINSTSSGNGTSGFFTISVTNSTAANNGGNGFLMFGGSATNCTAISNKSSGFSLFFGTVTGCAAIQNGANGISSDTLTVTNSIAQDNGDNGIRAPDGVVAFCKAVGNNTKNNGSLDISAAGATRTGNHPTP